MPDPIDRHIGRRLNRRRLQMKLDAPRVEQAIGVRAGTISRFEDGTRPLSAGQLFRLCQALDVSLAYPFEGLADLPTASGAPALPVPDADMEREIARFMKAYAAVDDTDLRKRLFNLVKSVADGDMDW